MEWFDADAWWWSRWLFTRGLGAVYVIAFVCAAHQWVPLLGSDGLLPAPQALARSPFRRAPSLFH